MLLYAQTTHYYEDMRDSRRNTRSFLPWKNFAKNYTQQLSLSLCFLTHSQNIYVYDYNKIINSNAVHAKEGN